MLVFISYGHGEYEDLIFKFSEDLKKNGIDVWIDKEGISPSSIWYKKIEKAIRDSKYVIGFLTKNSLRDSGFCLNELLYAMQNNVKVIPLKIDDVSLPIFMIRIQWVDIKHLISSRPDKEDVYLETFNKIVDEIFGKKSLEFKSEISGLESILNPIDNESLLVYNRTKYVGRKWLFEAYEDFLADKNRKFFIIFGYPGTGKTAFVTRLIEINDSISAIHFCVFGNEDRVLPNRVIESLAFHLSSQLPEYRAILLAQPKINQLKEMNYLSLFDYLILTPLHRINKPKKEIVIVIDALDEAKYNGRNLLFEILINELEKTPQWFKILITSRPEKEIVNRLISYDPIFLDDSEYKIKDFYDYIKTISNDNHKSITEDEISKLLDISNNNYIYIKEVVKLLQDDAFTDDFLPNELSSVYMINFNRIFKNKNSIDYRIHIRPMLEIILAGYDVFSIEKLAEITNEDEYDLYDYLAELEMFFSVHNDIIKPTHKTICDWLINREKSGEYFIRVKKGHKTLFSYYYQKYLEGNLDEYGLKHLIKHALQSDNYEKAIEILNDYTIFEKLAVFVGKINALYSYMNELASINNLGLDISTRIILDETFKKIFINNREIFLDSQLITLLPKIHFDVFVKKHLNSDEIWVRITILRYLRFLGDYTKLYEYARKTVNAFLKYDDSFALAKLYQFAALAMVYYGDYSKTNEYLNNALELIDGNSLHNWEYLTLNSFYADNYSNLANPKLSIKILEENVVELNKIYNIEEDYYFNKNIAIQLLDAQRCLVRLYTLTGEYSKANHHLNNALNLRMEFIQNYEDFNKFKVIEMFFYIATSKYDLVEELYEILLTKITTDFHMAMLKYYYSIYLMKKKTELNIIETVIEEGIQIASKRNNRLIKERLIIAKVLLENYETIEESGQEYLLENKDYLSYFNWLLLALRNIVES